MLSMNDSVCGANVPLGRRRHKWVGLRECVKLHGDIHALSVNHDQCPKERNSRSTNLHVESTSAVFPPLGTGNVLKHESCQFGFKSNN